MAAFRGLRNTRELFVASFDACTELVASWDCVVEALAARKNLARTMLHLPFPSRNTKFHDHQSIDSNDGIIALAGIRNWVYFASVKENLPDYHQAMKTSLRYSPWMRNFKWAINQLKDEAIDRGEHTNFRRNVIASVNILMRLIGEFERLQYLVSICQLAECEERLQIDP